MSLTQEDLQAIKQIVEENTIQLETKIDGKIEQFREEVKQSFADAKSDRQNLRELIIEQKGDIYDLAKRVDVLEGQQSLI